MTAPGGFVAGDTLTAAEVNALPGGQIAIATAAASQTGISTVADLTSLTATWTAVTGRSYRVTAHVPEVQQQTSTGLIDLLITDSSNTQVARSRLSLASTFRSPITSTVVLSGISGSVTYKARMLTSAGTVDVTLSSTQKAHFMVDDIGET